MNQKLSFVEFWFWFDTALECQRHEELKAEHSSIHSTPLLCTPWPVERQGRIMYTHNMFKIFQEEVITTRGQCFVVGIAQ
jgi:hypothetical protein